MYKETQYTSSFGLQRLSGPKPQLAPKKLPLIHGGFEFAGISIIFLPQRGSSILTIHDRF